SFQGKNSIYLQKRISVIDKACLVLGQGILTRKQFLKNGFYLQIYRSAIEKWGQGISKRNQFVKNSFYLQKCRSAIDKAAGEVWNNLRVNMCCFAQLHYDGYQFNTNKKILIAIIANFSKDDIDLTTYFEEITSCSKNITDIHGNLEPVSLKEGDSFNNFDEAELHVHRFAEFKGFKHAGSFKPKNTRKSIFVTIFNDEHNHDLSPKALSFEKNKQFTEELQKEIEFLVARCHLEATIVRQDSCWFVEVTWEEETNTLTNLFWMSPEQILLWCEFGEATGHNNTAGTNRYNMPLSLFVAQDDNMQSRIVTQAFVSNKTTGTYQWVLQMSKKATGNKYPHVFVTDTDPAMERAITLEYPKTQHLFCIWHVKQNVKKMLYSKLGDSFDEFYNKFWQCRNADMSNGFEYYWNQLVNYPTANPYLERYLYERQLSWARKVLMERSKEEQKRKQFEE
ncbi:3412_t:CDS:2, partial [Gigaspora rosea]